MDNKDIGVNIKKYAQEHGIMNRFLAEKAGVPDAKMSLILNGKQEIGVLEFFKICEALNVPAENFVKEQEG